MLSHKESILSPALNSQGKAWVTIQTVPGERGVSKDVFGVVAAFPANIRFTFSFRPQVLRISYTPPLKTGLFSTSRQRPSVLVCSFTLQGPTSLPPGPPINIHPNVFDLCPTSIHTFRSTLLFSLPGSGCPEAHLCRVNRKQLACPTASEWV